jgi:hypothetical protein
MIFKEICSSLSPLFFFFFFFIFCLSISTAPSLF